MQDGGGAAPMTRPRAWFLAVRPFSYPASLVPVLVGTAAAAESDLRPALFLLALLGSVLIHAATNLATDYFDFRHGVQPRETLGGVIQGGMLGAAEVHRAAIGSFALGAVCGLVIVAFTGWPVLAAGIASILAGYFYTAKPVMYGRRGLGEVMVFIFMGLVMVMGSYYVQLERLDWRALFAALPVGVLVANILHANNLRDIENDRARNKLTIASALDRPGADYVLHALTWGGCVAVAAAAGAGQLPVWTLLVALAQPAAWSAARLLRVTQATALVRLVRETATLHLRFGLLLTLGLLIDALG